MESVKAVATIGAPSEPEHVTHLLQHHIKEIEEQGFAEVNIDQRSFVIKKQFLEDIRSKEMSRIIKNLDKAILVMHSPQDGVVEIENAAKIYSNEGIAQFLFFKSDVQPETTYKSKNGKYQGQTTIQVAKIKK